MRRRIRAVRAWTTTHEGRKLIRFTLVSVVTTSVSFATIVVLYGFKIIPGVVWATLIGNVVASIPAYHLNRRWTWGKRGKSHVRREIIPFWTMTALGVLFSQLGAVWARHMIHTHHWSHLVNTALVAFMNLFAFAIFWVLKIMLFNRIFKVDELEEMDEHLTIEESTAS